MHTELEGHVSLKWEKVDFRAHGDALWVSMEDLQWQEIMEKWVTSYQTQIDGVAVTDIDITPDGSTIIYIYSKNKNGLNDVYLDVITNDSF